jgi:hypothetical protein
MRLLASKIVTLIPEFIKVFAAARPAMPAPRIITSFIIIGSPLIGDLSEY